MKTSRMMVFLLAGMVLVTIILVGVAAYLFLGGEMSLASPGDLHAYVQAPPVSSVGEEVILVVTVQNDTGEYLTVEEIRLPQSLLHVAQIASILPGTMEHTEYDGETGYQIGFLMAPGDRHEFVLTIVPDETEDVIGDIKVLAGSGKWQAVTGFRLVFEMPVAQAPALTEPPVEPTPTDILATVTAAPTASPTFSPLPYAAVVKITARLKHSSYLRDAWMGSGTIVSPDGLIVTNAHLVSPGQNFRPDVWEISITDDPAEPPTELYFADPLVVDEDLDLAVFHIATDLHYKPVDPQKENLTYVTLGDSSELQLGESLVIMGYPGIGGDTITLTRGDVGGFTLIGQLVEPAFIKTSATISGGTSGGVALDQNGRMVAIPTQLGYGQREGEIVDCRVLADTNMDGRINQNDACIPVGGFINALRPVNLVKPLIEEARRILLAGPTETAYPPPD